MKYVWIVPAVLALLLIVTVMVLYIRRKRAKERVRRRSLQEKCRDLNAALAPFGFVYDPGTDSFYSGLNPWQRGLGYSRFYDENAPMMNMVIDCDPIYFTYDGRNYLIQFWKGQYGMSTGAEIGVYVAGRDDRENGRETGQESGSVNRDNGWIAERVAPEQLVYESITDQELLPMGFVLRKNGRVLLERAGRHWWLTGFVMGEFSHRTELSMELWLEFPNIRMRNAFVEGLVRAGYERENVWVERNRVGVFFVRPKTRQPRHLKCHIGLVQWMNRWNCKRYLKLTRPFTTTIDRVDYIGMCFPRLYRSMIAMGRSRSMRKAAGRRKYRSAGRYEKAGRV